MEDPEFRRMGDTQERLIEFAKDPEDFEQFNTLWESLQVRELRMLTYSMAKLVTKYRLELGHPPDAEYGPRG